jgi:hypothetical protein
MNQEYTFDYAEELYNVLCNEPDTYVETGLISGSKLGYAPLTAILKMIGVSTEFDGYTLGKFRRGHDLEMDIITLLWGTPPAEGEWYATKRGTKACWQYRPEVGYRGTSVTMDLIEDFGEYYVIHEIKSATKMSWDKTAGAGYSKWVRTKKGEQVYPEVKPHNAIQSALQGLVPMDKPVNEVLIHYINADDYRIITFKIDPEDYREQIDHDINAILEAFTTKILPEYTPRWGWDKGKYNNFVDYEKLSSAQIREKLKNEHKEALDKFMLAKVEGDNIIYSDTTS